jgi:hypothetical protein
VDASTLSLTQTILAVADYVLTLELQLPAQGIPLPMPAEPAWRVA